MAWLTEQRLQYSVGLGLNDRLTAFATDTNNGQTSDFELLHRCAEGTDPEREGHRSKKPYVT